MHVDLYELFHETAVRQPHRPAIWGPGADMVMTYEELDRVIQETARRLHRAGIRGGDCVGLHYPSGRHYIVLTYALWRCGAAVVPIATELAAPEKAEICREIAIDHLLSQRETAAFAEPFHRDEPIEIAPNITCVAIASPQARPTGYERLHGAFIRFTSGTTGTSKGVVLCHDTVRDRIEAANEVLHIGPADRVVWLLPMAYHFTVSIVSYLTFGATIVLPANHFATAILTAAQRRHATLIYASPAQWALMADYPQASRIPNLRLAISTTTALDHRVARKFHEQYGVPLTQALGIIEVGLPCINIDFAAEKCDSVGRVLPAYQLRLEDIGLEGGLRETYFRGKGMLDAYYHPWRTREEIMPDGWFRTGDLGELDADGCLFLRGRHKDVISVKGMKFFPQEVESVLESHPGIAEAAVWGHQDSRSGEVPHASIVLRPGIRQEELDGQLRRWCAARLASYKVPVRIDIVEALPRTASGKVLRREIVGGRG